MSGDSWSHRLVRPLVRPLVGTGITPNHLTSLRLIVGIAACGALMIGKPDWNLLGGWLWIFSLLLDYADGELARLGNLATPNGHLYDFVVDNIVNSLFFFAIGVGLRQELPGHLSIVLGAISGLSVCISSFCAEALERRLPAGNKAWSGAFGFYPEDLLYLAAPLAWLGWLLPLLIGASVGAPIAMVLIGRRLLPGRHKDGHDANASSASKASHPVSGESQAR